MGAKSSKSLELNIFKDDQTLIFDYLTLSQANRDTCKLYRVFQKRVIRISGALFLDSTIIHFSSVIT